MIVQTSTTTAGHARVGALRRFTSIRRVLPFINDGSRRSRKVVDVCDFLSSRFKMSGQNVETTNEVHSEKSDLSTLRDYAVKWFRGKDRRNIEQFGKRLLEAVKERMKDVKASGGMILQLLGNTNNAYKVSMTKESKEELCKAKEQVDGFVTNHNMGAKPEWSGETEDELDDGGGDPDDDPGVFQLTLTLTRAQVIMESRSSMETIGSKPQTQGGHCRAEAAQASQKGW